MRRAFLLLLPVSLLALACNSVLGNDQGQPGGSDDGSPDASFEAMASYDSSATFDAGAQPDTSTFDSGPVGCADGTKRCDGICASVTDPLYGCTGTSCAPCALDHATATCTAGGCAVGSCAPGFADCDQNPANGCETDLSQASHCGACNAVCPSTAPNCGAVGNGAFMCMTGCTPSAPTLCGNQCVDTTTSPTHCGGCNDVCPTPQNSVATCTQSKCGFTCNQGFHACGAACASNVSPQSCGSSCSPCPSGPNSSPTCMSGACGIACDPGFANCDGNPASGCPVNVTNDVRNCGGCGRACPAEPNANPTCAGAMCGIACVPGFADCDMNAGDGCEVNTTNDVRNCGGCGKACPGGANATPTCMAGACGIACNAGFADCNMNPADGCEVNTTNDARNCGGCGKACAMGDSCMNSMCVAPPPPPDAGPG